MHLSWLGYGPRLVAISEKGEGTQLSSCNVNGIPFQDYGGLGSIPTAENGGRGCALAKGAVDGGLEGVKGGCRISLRLEIARNGNVDDAARRYVWGE